MNEEAVIYATNLHVGNPTAKLVLLVLAQSARNVDDNAQIFGLGLRSPDLVHLSEVTELDVGQIKATLRYLRNSVPMDVLEHEDPEPHGLFEIVFGPIYTSKDETEMEQSP